MCAKHIAPQMFACDSSHSCVFPTYYTYASRYNVRCFSYNNTTRRKFPQINPRELRPLNFNVQTARGVIYRVSRGSSTVAATVRARSRQYSVSRRFRLPRRLGECTLTIVRGVQTRTSFYLDESSQDGHLSQVTFRAAIRTRPTTYTKIITY